MKRRNCGVALYGLFLSLFAADLQAATLTLAWDPSVNAAGYILVYGTSSGNYTNQIDVGALTEMPVSGLADGTTYYFAVRAYAVNGLQSDLSDEVAGTTPVRHLLTVSVQGSGNVASGDGAIECPPTCGQLYVSTAVVNLRPTPSIGYVFGGWSPSECSTGTVLMTADHACTAAFMMNGNRALIWQNDTTRQVTLWHMGGSQGDILQAWSWLSAAGVSGWRVVGSADFNGDGQPDLVWQNDSTGQVTVWYMGGAQGDVFLGWNWLSLSEVPGWSVVGIADFNGDGKPDLVWQNDLTRQVSVWYMSGAQGSVLQGWRLLSSGGVPGWKVVGTGDFNGDGKPDLIWQNDATQQVTVWYMSGAQGTVWLGWTWLTTESFPGWRVVGSADFNGDGKPDLVWQNESTGQVTVWYMGGSQGDVRQSWTWLSSSGFPGWHVRPR